MKPVSTIQGKASANDMQSPNKWSTKFNMKDATKRSIVRWIHIVCSIPIIGYIYSPFEQIPNYAPATRLVFFPVMLLSGLWMWKGHVLRRLVSKGSSQQVMQADPLKQMV